MEETKEREFKRGEMYVCEKFYESKGSEQDLKDGRPCVIVSSDRFNKSSPVVTVALCSHRTQGDNYINHVRLKDSNNMTCVFGEHLLTVSKTRLAEYIGKVTDNEMNEINDAINYCLFSNTEDKYDYRFTKKPKNNDHMVEIENLKRVNQKLKELLKELL